MPANNGTLAKEMRPAVAKVGGWLLYDGMI